MPQTALIIPAYQPNQQLILLIEELLAQNPSLPIIVVDDGSGADYQSIFQKLKSLFIKVLHHETNLGKGAALKTAFQYYLQESEISNTTGVITADADGQHTSADILRIYSLLQQTQHTLHIGTRQFEKNNIPLRSQIGNRFTRATFSLFNRVRLQDTQSGLRGIPLQLMKEMITSETSRYDFELEMLMRAVKLKIPIRETPITTIYLDNNSSSHFKPVLDSAKVYFVFVRFAAVSFLSGIIDYAIFFSCYFLYKNIFFALSLGRFISGAFNYYFNKRFAFQNNKHFSQTGIRYILFAVILALMSYLIIHWLHTHGQNIFVSKVIAESVIYLFNFAIQRSFIFNNQKSAEST